ncbi:hypothetical protein K461DRAFT_223684 [Myriangium duriaei CBS 260.36]|uniref:Proteasome activator subunit 4 n=1 Tax=Myriangium duriaei CBS 260.36 TaxID=1168546 RepID=A0A9P4MI83_9PEZI|nr:hypothetical protein K461DRAFT_223684 [Myriangium duriaei CBS 260.36]
MSGASSRDISRTASPGPAWTQSNGEPVDFDEEHLGRSRPRVFPYAKYLPYDTETESKREQDLDEMIKHLYIAVAAGDFVPGAVHWTKEIRGWMTLKFDLTRRQRLVLVKLYYELSLAPGLDYSVSERFASMFMVLTKRKHYLRPGKDLVLDWRPLYKEIKIFVLPCEYATQNTYSSKRNIRTLTKLCTFAQLFFDPKEIPALLEELLPFFSMSFSEHAFVVLGLTNLLFPTSVPPADRPDLYPQQYLPTFFHIWSIFSRSLTADQKFIDLFSRLARDCMGAEHIPWSEHGIFTEAQSTLIFTSILRLLEIPVGQSTSPYSVSVDVGAGLSILLDRDQRKHPTAHSIARWIIMSLSPTCLHSTSQKSILHQLEGLIQGIETFFHPSNSGSWTKSLSQLVYYLADFFVMRWNREQNGEYDVPDHRKLTPELKHRFVLCLREVVFMGIFAKSGTAMNYSLSTLQSLAFLEPSLILPGALQRIYPAMQGLVEVHRTVSSIRALQMLSRVMARTKGYRCHLTTLLGLALPGIDANDLDKTMHSLAFIQSVCYNIPLHDLTKEKRQGSDSDGVDQSSGTATAVQWITEQMERFEREGALISLDYDNELSDQDEETILRSSTAGFAEFLISFMGRVFTLLQNLPDASRVKTGSPEENIVNTLPATFSPLLAALSPELYDIALQQVSKFITNHVVHQARDAMAFICNALVKVSPKKALAHLLPGLISSIRTEIDENGAGSTRTTGSEILPRDRALVWNISLLSMCIVHVGADVLDFQDELFDIAVFMQANCKGIPLVHVSNFVHHLLLNLTVTYTIDYALFEGDDFKSGLGPQHWGCLTDARGMNVKWHSPSEKEIAFAIKLFQSQGGHAIDSLDALIGEDPPVRRDGTGKDWSDEVSRHLVLLRLITSGASCLFRSDDPSVTPFVHGYANGKPREAQDVEMEDAESDETTTLMEPEDEKIRKSFQYPTGYPLDENSESFRLVHELRKRTGETLHRVHTFLTKNQEDDVPCFNALYTAYKSWFIDIGIERSAHVLDRLTRLFAADVHPFKFSGTRKAYPRPLLVKRANLYHFQRLRHNESPRGASELDKTLLLDLAQSSVSLYTDIRRTAQSAGEAAIKCIVGAKPLIIPPLLDALETALEKSDIPRIKGAVFALLFGSLAKPIGRNWNNAPRMIRLFLKVSEFDRPSIQKLVSDANFQISDMCKATDRLVVLDPNTIKSLWPTSAASTPDTVAKSIEDADAMVPSRQDKIRKRRFAIESKKSQLGQELIHTINISHWKKATRTAVLVVGLDYRFETIASEGMLDLVVKGAIDPHPSLRQLYAGALIAIFNLVQTRALVDHKFENYVINKQFPPDRVSMPVHPEVPDWTEKHLDAFSKPEAEHYIDCDYPGWLVWNKSIRCYNTNAGDLPFDEVEKNVRKRIGSMLDRKWFSTYFDFMKQEPRDSHSDRFRMTSSMIVAYSLELVFDGIAVATFDDIKDLTLATYGDGSDKHQHRATAEIMGACLTTAEDLKAPLREKIWEFVLPLVIRVFQDGLTPENSSYWNTFVSLVLGGKDPRRCWPLVDWIAGFRLDMSTNAAFKESSKISLLGLIVNTLGWHFQLEKPILEDFLKHLDHPYKGVREVMGATLASIYRTRYYEGFKDVQSLLEAQRAHASDGIKPYAPTQDFSSNMKGIFDQLEIWRKERPAGIQAPTPYTQASKTVLLWLDTTLSSNDCRSLVSFFPDTFMEQLLHMMDVKEDPELQSLAYHVFRHLPNVPHMPGTEDSAFINALVRIGRTSSLWHQRLRILINIQVIYFRHLFLMSQELAQSLFDCVRDMLHDVQLEVRLGAGATLSGMIRCSPKEFRDSTVAALQKHFTDLLVKNPLPKKKAGRLDTAPGTPTPEQNKLVLTRHAAVLGLGALVQAFPYSSPPPEWLPEVLSTLAGKAAADPGTVGKSVKSVLSDFKKTRQDTWHVDVKAFKPEQLEDLEGVLWKSYFA